MFQVNVASCASDVSRLGAISRTADVWKVEVLRLKAAVQQRQCLNAGLRQEARRN